MAHKIFSLTVHLPVKVVRWIGQVHDDLGVASDEGRVRGVAMAAGARIGEGTGNASRGMQKDLRGAGAGGGGGDGGRGGGNGPQQPTRGDVELATFSGKGGND